MKAKDSASSSDEIAVFQAYIDLINSELETIWARHNALVVANSLIIGAPTISPSALWGNKWGPFLLISAAWVGIKVWDGRRCDGMLILPEPSLQPASSIFPIRSPRRSATARRPGSITSSCW